MAATFTPSGTWTALSTDVSGLLMDGRQLTSTSTASSSLNTPQAFSLNGLDFRTVPEEVFQIIELIQNGYSTGAAPNIKRMSFWSAAVLLRAWLNAVFDGATATNPQSLAGQTRV